MKPATIYFSDAEHARLVALATVRHVKLSALIRSLALQAADREASYAGAPFDPPLRRLGPGMSSVPGTTE